MSSPRPDRSTPQSDDRRSTPTRPTAADDGRRRRRAPTTAADRRASRPTDGDVDAAADAEAPAEDDEVDPVEEMRAALRRAPGDWYVVHSYAGYENKVKTNLETRITTLDMEDYIFQVEVPTEEVPRSRTASASRCSARCSPATSWSGWSSTTESWGAVRNTPGVTGFVGRHLDAVAAVPRRGASSSCCRGSRPSRPPAAASPTGVRAGQVAVEVDFEVGDRSPSSTARSPRCRPRSTRSTSTQQKLKVLVSIFGRETPVELDFSQVTKI